MGLRAQNGRLRKQLGTPSQSGGCVEAVAISPAPESALAKLEGKRDAYIARREQLTAQYEADLKEVIERVEEIDRVLADVKRLSEEPV
jgi:hypothetical protein